MEDGSVKSIQDINPGDFVITHNLVAKPIRKIFVKEFSGKLNSFTINNSINLSSLDPLFLRLGVYNDRWKSDTSPFRIFNEPNTIKSISFSDSGFLLSPVLKNYSDNDLNEGKARLLGLYAAEGSLHKNNNKYKNEINFTFSSKEIDTLAAMTKSLLEREFTNIKVSIKIIDSKCLVSAYSKDIYKFFLYHCGEYSHLKKVSVDLLNSDESIIKEFILGWLEGDGHIQSDNRIVGTTVSRSLASQVRLMLYKLNIHNTIYKQNPSNSSVIEKSGNIRNIVGRHDVYRVRINSTNAKKIINNSDKLSLNRNITSKNMTKFYNNYCMHKIIKTKYIDYNGNLFCLDVESDNSFVANYMIVHQ